MRTDHEILMEKAREIQVASFMSRTPVRKEKSIKAKCSSCGRDMEAPDWERGPKYCWRCGDKYEVGNAREY